MANKAIKYRIYPTTEQRIMFAKTFGCCRKVYNLMLTDKIEGYRSTGEFPNVTPTQYKDKYPYLKEVDSLALANVKMNLWAAFRHAFNKSYKRIMAFLNLSLVKPEIATPPITKEEQLLSLTINTLKSLRLVR